MKKITNKDIIIAMIAISIVVWIVLFIAAFFCGYSTINVLGTLLAFTLLIYVMVDELLNPDFSIKVIYSKEEESN